MVTDMVTGRARGDAGGVADGGVGGGDRDCAMEHSDGAGHLLARHPLHRALARVPW